MSNPIKTRSKMNNNTVLLLITIALFFVLYGFGCVLYGDKGFTHMQTFLNLLINNSGLICVACGETLVMLTAGIDISVGSLVAMDCMIMAVGVEQWGWSAPMLIVFILLVGIVFGLVQGFLISKLKIQPFIVTMAGLFFGRGMTAVLNQNQISIQHSDFLSYWANLKLYMPFNLGAYMNRKGKLVVPYVYINVIIALIVLVIIFVMLRKTRFGRSLYAVGGSQQSAAMMGLNVERTTMLAHVLCSFLSSIGGICYVLNTMCGTATQAAGLEMDAISSAVIGGTLLTGGVGNVVGTFFGVLINGTISSIVKTDGHLASSWPNVLTALLLCFFIMLQAVFARLKEKNK